MVNLRLLALLHIAAAVHDDAAGNRAIGAGVACLGRLRELERPDMGGDLSLRLAKSECRNGRPRRTGPCQLDKVPARDFDVHGMATSSNAPLEVLAVRLRSICQIMPHGIPGQFALQNQAKTLITILIQRLSRSMLHREERRANVGWIARCRGRGTHHCLCRLKSRTTWNPPSMRNRLFLA